MTERNADVSKTLTEYGKGCSPSAIQRKYGVTYEPGGELAEKLELEKAKLKSLLKEIRQQITKQVFGSNGVQIFEGTFDNKLLAKIDQVLGEKNNGN